MIFKGVLFDSSAARDSVPLLPQRIDAHQFLSRLLLLLAQDKISTRRAAVLAYITNQLLRTLPAIAKEEGQEGTTIIFDPPRPDRSDRIAQDPPQQTTPSSPSNFAAPELMKNGHDCVVPLRGADDWAKP